MLSFLMHKEEEGDFAALFVAKFFVLLRQKNVYKFQFSPIYLSPMFPRSYCKVWGKEKERGAIIA